jgi:hypothetical protein
MGRVVRRRLWMESALAAVTSIALIVTLVWPEWIEAVLGVDPDGGDGSLEWAVVTMLAVASVSLSLAARAEWQRTELSCAGPEQP